jgi:hypothetical protein
VRRRKRQKGNATVAGDEPVTSPDQHRPTVSGRAARTGVIISVAALITMGLVGNNEGHVEDFYTFGTAGLLVLILIVDWLMRRTGLKSD